MWVETINKNVRINMQMASMVEEVHTPIYEVPKLVLARDRYDGRCNPHMSFNDYCGIFLGATEKAYNTKARLDYEKAKEDYVEEYTITWRVYVNGKSYTLPEDPLINY